MVWGGYIRPLLRAPFEDYPPNFPQILNGAPLEWLRLPFGFPLNRKTKRGLIHHCETPAYTLNHAPRTTESPLNPLSFRLPTVHQVGPPSLRVGNIGPSTRPKWPVLPETWGHRILFPWRNPPQSPRPWPLMWSSKVRWSPLGSD